MEGNMISSASDKSNKVGKSHSPEYDIEAAIGLKSGAVGQERVVYQTFLSTIVGFCYRYKKLLSWPVIAVLIGVLVVLLVFGFYFPSTKSIASTASPLSRISFGQAEAAVYSRLDGAFQSHMPIFVKNHHQSRVARAGMAFELKVLDTLQGEANAILQAQSEHSKGKYLRRYAELGAKLTKKKRMRKYKNKKKVTEVPRDEGDEEEDEEDARGILILKFCERFPMLEKYFAEHPFHLVVLWETFDTDVLTRFLDFCDEFPQLANAADWSPRLLFTVFRLRGFLGHEPFTVLLKTFLAFTVLLTLILYFSPWRSFLRYLIFLISVQRKKRY